ncbi:MAG: hypothetical protein H7327_12360 [Herminiimonas sp.]|nr:hypothetical protein [Herminiimonas sp.]
MHTELTLHPPTYDPNQLLDMLLLRLELKNDAALSRALDVARPVLAGIRRGTVGIGAWLLLRISEISGLSIADLRQMMGDQRRRLRVATARAPRT